MFKKIIFTVFILFSVCIPSLFAETVMMEGTLWNCYWNGSAWVCDAQTQTYHAEWASADTYFKTVAGEALSRGDAVAMYQNGAWKADADLSNRNPCIGFAAEDTAAGAELKVIVKGLIKGAFPVTAGAGTRLYLSTSESGGITTTAPAVVQALGWVMPRFPHLATANPSTPYMVSSGAYYINVAPQPYH